MLLTALVAAGLSTVLLAVLWYVDVYQLPPPPPPPPPGGGGRPPRPPGIRASLAVAVGVFAVAWVSVILVACRDQIVRRVDQAADRVLAATLEFAEQREEDGIFRGMHMASPANPDPGGPGPSGSGTSGPGPGGSGPSGGPGPSGGAHVVPFPRHAPPPDTSDD
jgi:hypothetical protein